jgi:hypothetical protein
MVVFLLLRMREFCPLRNQFTSKASNRTERSKNDFPRRDTIHPLHRRGCGSAIVALRLGKSVIVVEQTPAR